MTVSAARDEGGALGRVRRENETLYAVIKTVSSSLALERVLGGIVEIATDATGCHACFIYFLEDERLVLRAASPRYAHLVGQLAWGTDEGLTGWVARTSIARPATSDPAVSGKSVGSEEIRWLGARPAVSSNQNVDSAVSARPLSGTRSSSTTSNTEMRSDATISMRSWSTS